MQLTSRDPAQNYERIGQVRVSTAQEIETQVKKARGARNKWAGLTVQERVNHLKRVYQAVKKQQEEISHLVVKEIGFAIKDQILFDIGDGLVYFEWYLKNAVQILAPEVTFQDKSEKHTVYYEPHGVAAVIQPWNFPFCQWVWSVIPALLTGNTVVFKHSENCPLTGQLLGKIIRSTSLPQGVFSQVYGNGKVGAKLLDQEVDIIVFTGSYQTGQAVYEKASQKFIPCLLELGGSAPGIVFKDADLEAALEHISAVRFTNNGQVCDGLKRLIVEESIFEVVVQKLKKMLESKVIGDPLNNRTDFGPLVSRGQQELIQDQVLDAVKKGAKVVTGGSIPAGFKGAYFSPTILINIKDTMRVWQEEVFGPVLPIITFKTKAQALELANDTEYGLGGYIYTKNQTLAKEVAQQLKTGMVSINGANYVQPFNPFGGYKHSGLGRSHGYFGLRELSQVKVVS